MMHFSPLCNIIASRLACLLAICTLMAGCAGTPPIDYYQLSANSNVREEFVAGEISNKVIGIGPVRLPESLDRPQIITRLDANRIKLSDNHRWIEPLADNISRVLRENLSVLLTTDRFQYYPWSRSAAVDYQLIVDIIRFEGEGYKTANLEAVWWIQNGEGKILLPPQRSSYLANTSTQDYESLASGLSKTLDLFCREIARQLSNLASEAEHKKS